ncbi:MAG: secretion protein HlyD family protein [Anaerocolumna sp.]|jgi:HlyD family secretion protein|nr:secretion protein HlyD family protein [Anaerocolumna sp.]
MSLLKRKSDNSVANFSNKKFRWKKLLGWVAILLVIVIASRVIFVRFIENRIQKTSAETTIETANVETRDIQVVLSSSGTVQPLNTYEVSTLVEGEVIAADFEEGDQVEKGDALYQIATDTLDSQIETSETSVSRAEKEYDKAIESLSDKQEKYNEALEDYQEAAKEYGALEVTATASGTIKNVLVKEGDSIQNGTQIAEVYDNSYMLLVVPFNASEINSTYVGKKAEVEITDSFESLEGEITKVSNTTEVLSGNRVVKTVTIKVKNPGGLTTTNTATASVGDLYSSSEGTFKVLEETTIKADKNGKIDVLNIEEGSTIKEGETILTLTSDSVEDQLESYKNALENAEDAIENAKDSVENAEDSIEDAKSNLEDVIDSKTDYSVTAPISGQVIRKDTLVGDTISKNNTMCVIYDLSALEFEMSIDELDVMSVKVGQEVNITADAIEGISFKGIVTNVSLESTNSNGVTQYPVTVRIDEPGDLLPGMNVTGEIILEEAKGVIAIPSDALMRGDVVYVADSTVTEAVGNVPKGFKEVKVETGLSDGDYIEIKSGLTGDEQLYVKRVSEAVQSMMPAGGFSMQGGFGDGSMGGNSNRTRPSGGGNFGGGMGTMP